MRLRITFLTLAPIVAASGVLFACSSFTAEDDKPVVEAGVDSGIPACPSVALVCDHFERDNANLTDNWNAGLFGDSSIIVDLDPTMAKTGTKSLHARDQGTGGSGALAVKTSADVPIRIEFDLRISRVQPLSTLLVSYVFDNATTSVSVALESKGIKISEQIGPTSYFDTPALEIEPNVWTHVVFTFDAKKLAVLELPGNQKVQRTITNPTSSATGVRVGLPYVVSHKEDVPFEVWYDDIVITR